jgi:hypothetical protein
MSAADGATAAGVASREQWVVATSRPGATVRLHAGGTGCPGGESVWVEVRALTHREALERESLGIAERYELAEGGKVLALRREYDFWAMCEYDYRHSLVAFSLPADGAGALVTSEAMGPEERIRLLGLMPPALADWVQRCVDEVNLRDGEGLSALEYAQKK